jgi:hypothetical protein
MSAAFRRPWQALRAGLFLLEKHSPTAKPPVTRSDGFAFTLAPLPHWFAPTRTGKAIRQRADEALSFVDSTEINDLKKNAALSGLLF